jgi:hypothetical protein
VEAERIVTEIEVLRAQLVDTDTSRLADDELHSVTVMLHRHTALEAAARAHFTQPWTARRVWAGNGSRTAAARLARETGSAPATANRECRRARKSVSMPLAFAALAAGEISVDVFDALARCNTGRFRGLYAPRRSSAARTDPPPLLRRPAPGTATVEADRR